MKEPTTEEVEELAKTVLPAEIEEQLKEHTKVVTKETEVLIHVAEEAEESSK